MLINNMNNVIQSPTRVTQFTSTSIDPIAVTTNIQVLHSGTFDTPREISDHFGTFIFFKADFDINKPFKRKVWNYNKADFMKFNTL